MSDTVSDMQGAVIRAYKNLADAANLAAALHQCSDIAVDEGQAWRALQGHLDNVKHARRLLDAARIGARKAQRRPSTGRVSRAVSRPGSLSEQFGTVAS